RYLTSLPSFPTRRSSDLDCGSGNRFSGCGFSNSGGGSLSSGAAVVVQNTAHTGISTEAHFNGCNFNGGDSGRLADAIRVVGPNLDRKSTRLNSSHQIISY